DLAGYRRGVEGNPDRHRLLLSGVHEHGRRRAQRRPQAGRGRHPTRLQPRGADEADHGAGSPALSVHRAAQRSVDGLPVRGGSQIGFSRAALMSRIMVPAALPYLFTGLRNGQSMAWLCVVAAELLAATEGIGYLLTDGREVSRPDLVLAAIITLALMGKLTDSLLKHLEKRMLGWRDNFNGKEQSQ